MRDAPRQAKPLAKPKRDKPEDIIDKTMNVVDAIATGVENWKKFQSWINTPPSVTQPKVLKTAASKLEMHREPFDIQDIPVTVRRLGMWQAAKIFEKWFEGDLNYSITEKDANLEINHLGKQYPESMIDKKSIKIDWILKFPRAKVACDELINSSRWHSHAKVVSIWQTTRHIARVTR